MTDTELDLLASIPKGSITGFTIFTRSAPPCQFCMKAKMTLKSQFAGIPVKETDISSGEQNQQAWAEVLKTYPSARSLPQIFIEYEIDSEPKKTHIGGADDLAKLCGNRKAREMA